MDTLYCVQIVVVVLCTENSADNIRKRLNTSVPRIFMDKQ